MFFFFLLFRDELQIGSIYINIYNEQPTFPIQNPISFVYDLLDFLKQGYQYFILKRKFQKHIISTTSFGNTATTNTGIKSLSTPSSGQILQPTLADNHPQRQIQKSSASSSSSSSSITPLKRTTIDGVLNEYNRSKVKSKLERNDSTTTTTTTSNSNRYNFETNPNAVEHIIQVLRALIAVTKSNESVEIQCIGHFEMLFGFLSANLCDRDREIKALALEIVSLVSRNKECVSEIAANELLGLFLVTLRDTELKDMQERVLDTLSGLLNVQRMIKEAQNKGAVIYLLDLFCNSRNPAIREKCAEILGKMTADKLTGPKVRISVCKFLPSVFLDAMIESPEISVQMFESTHEHPELIWNDRTRTAVIEAISDSGIRFNAAQRENPLLWWKDADTLDDIMTNELVVSGVYLKLFVSNPGWTLRKPKQFLSDLLDFVVDNINRSGVEVIGTVIDKM